jgi:hypothetical protein
MMPLWPRVSMIRQSWGYSAVFCSSKGVVLRTATHHWRSRRDGYCELYGHRAVSKAPRNISAEHPGLIEELRKCLQWRIALRKN